MSIQLSHIVLVTLIMYQGTIYVGSPTNPVPFIIRERSRQHPPHQGHGYYASFPQRPLTAVFRLLETLNRLQGCTVLLLGRGVLFSGMLASNML